MTGTFGEYGVMSFNGNKMITTSGGGALICPNQEAKNKIMFYATQARENKPYYLHQEIGYNYRMSNVCAGIGRGQMTVAEDHIRHHQRIARMYAEAFDGHDIIRFHKQPETYMDANFWLCTITFETPENDKPLASGMEVEPCEMVTRAMAALRQEGIESRPLWRPMHTQPVYKDAPAYVNGISERMFHKGLCLPSGPCVTDAHVEKIISILKQVAR